MNQQTEVMDRRRKRLLIWILVSFGVWYGMFLLYGFAAIFFNSSEHPFTHFIAEIRPLYFSIGACVAVLSGFFLIRWALYKRNLMKNPALRSAVDDERVKQTWLKAYRFAFQCLVGMILFLFIIRFGNAFLGSWLLGVVESMGIHWLLFTAVVSCLGAFLVYNREGKA
jgi:hypothetical protein